MFVLLDVVPDELVSEPCGLALSELRIESGEVVGDGETVTALLAHHDLHHLRLGWRSSKGRRRAGVPHPLSDRCPAEG